MAKRKKLIQDDEGSEEMTLQITSMADIFTIILVFLLKSVSSGMTSISPAQGILLPSVEVSSKNQIKEALILEVGSDSVMVDQKPVSMLSKYLASNEEELQKNVLQALLSQRKVSKDKKIAENGGNPRDPASFEEADSHLLILADEKTPYATLKTIMGSAATAGYVDLQLVVLKPE